MAEATIVGRSQSSWARGSRVAEATVVSLNHHGRAAHAWPNPTIVSRNHPWTRGSRVAEANTREPTIVLGARRPKRPKPTIGKPLYPLERGSRVAEANNREPPSPVEFEFEFDFE